ncbi:MAG: hypothetical protein QHH14_07975 [Clostridiales bacterium]|jgi:hypothetical protein|nr:hypothetical protein [Clostridiales bacterium]
MNKRSLLAGACLVLILLLSSGPAASGEETHPCTDVYARCLAVALLSDLSLRGAYKGIQACTAMFAACTVFFYL